MAEDTDRTDEQTQQATDAAAGAASDAAHTDATAAAATDAAAASSEAKQTATEGPRHFKDDKRAAIAARHAERVLETSDPSLAAAQADSQARMGAEHTEEAAAEAGTGTVAAATADTNASSDEGAAGAAAAGTPATTRVKVYGVELEVPTADVQAAGGVDAYQKREAVDAQLRRSVELNKTLEAQIAANNARSTSSDQATTAAASPPSGEQAAGDTKKVAREAMEALLESDADRFTDALGKVVEGQVQARMRAQPAAPAAGDAKAGATAASTTSTTPGRSQDEIARANAVFEREYGALGSNADAMQAATEIMRSRMSDPAFAAVPLETLARDVGARVARLAGVPGGSQPQGGGRSTPDRLADRRTLKARVPVTTAAPAAQLAGASSQPQPTPAQRNSAYIANLRARSGSNSAIAHERAAR